MQDAALERSRGDAGPVVAALPWIDWIRFLAALQVFLFHLGSYSFPSYNDYAETHRNPAFVIWRGATNYGFEAVLVFFALSGYLVGGGLIDRARAGTFRPTAYAIDRATRLMLPFVPALVVSLAIQAIKNEPIDMVRTLGNLTSLQIVLVRVDPYLGVDWSLAYETWFYILGGALAAFFTVRKGRGLALAVTAISLLVLSASKQPTMIFLWVIGAVFSQLPLRTPTWRAILVGTVICIFGLYLLNGAFAAYRPTWLDYGNRIEPLSSMLVTSGVLVVIRNLVEMRPKTHRAAQIDRFGTRLARFSYSLYLIHIPVLALLVLAFPDDRATVPLPLRYAFFAISTLIMAYGFYWLFERRTDAARRWLKQRLGVS